jgi:DNA-binding NtrC family response regulator
MAGERLLVVDDEAVILDLFRDYFTGLGYQVVTASSGRDAIDNFSPGRFACVLCDYYMPEMNGTDLLERLQKQDGRMPFLMMTGHPSVEGAVEVIKKGAYDYIIKPVNLEDVRIKVERAIHVKGVEKSLRKINGLLWGVIVSVPIWLLLGIVVGAVWKHF